MKKSIWVWLILLHIMIFFQFYLFPVYFLKYVFFGTFIHKYNEFIKYPQMLLNCPSQSLLFLFTICSTVSPISPGNIEIATGA